MKTLLFLALGLSLTSPALASSPIDYMEGDWFSTTTIYDAAEDGSDLVLSQKQHCERSGTVAFSCTVKSEEGQLIMAFFWSIDPKTFETRGYYVNFIHDIVESRRGTWDPKARTWTEYHPGMGGGIHILSDMTQENRQTVEIFSDDNGKPGVLTMHVESRR
jgi:hypothetical protein